MNKCSIKSSFYFYNNYYKIYDKNGNEVPKRKVTEKEFKEIIDKINSGVIHYKGRNINKPLPPDKYFKNLPSFLKRINKKNYE